MAREVGAIGGTSDWRWVTTADRIGSDQRHTRSVRADLRACRPLLAHFGAAPPSQRLRMPEHVPRLLSVASVVVLAACGGEGAVGPPAVPFSVGQSLVGQSGRDARDKGDRHGGDFAYVVANLALDSVGV